MLAITSMKMRTFALVLQIFLLFSVQTIKVTHYHDIALTPDHKIIYTTQFPQGQLYLLISTNSNQALKMEAGDPKAYEKSKVIGSFPNSNELSQLWFIEKTSTEQDSYQIVNAMSNNVWDEEGSEIRLRAAEQKSDQLFKIQKVPNTKKYWFKTSNAGSMAAALFSVLETRKFDPNSIQQSFYIAPVVNPAPLQETCIFETASRSKALDSPALFPSQQLIAKEKDSKFGQRWKWVRYGSGYLLQNMLTNLYIEVKDQSKINGTPVIQSVKTFFINQIWVPVVVAGGNYKIRSGLSPNLYLTQKSGKIIVTDGDQPGQLWKISGYFPKL